MRSASAELIYFESEPFPVAVVGLYRAWRAMRAAGGDRLWPLWVMINDLAPLDLTPQLPNLKSEDDVAKALDILIERSRNEPESPTKGYTEEKLRQSRFYVGQIQHQTVTPEIVTARGMPWLPIDRAEAEEIVAVYRAAERTCEAAGHSREQIQSRSKIHNAYAGMAQDIIRIGTDAANALRARFPFLKPFTIQEEFVNDKTGWRNIVSRSPAGFRLILNHGPLAAYSSGLISYLRLHEIAGHMVHFAFLEAQPHLVEKAPHLLCLSSHTQDSVYMEGVGEFITELTAEAPSLEWLELRRIEAYLAVRHCNMCDLIIQKTSIEEAACWHSGLLGEPEELMRRSYAAYLGDPFFSSQVLSYYPSLKILNPAKDLASHDLSQFLAKLMRQPMDFKSLLELVNQYTN